MSVAKTQRLSFPEREARILDAAGRLFSERGFVGTTTRAIALESGVNEALLFRHFKTKEDLYTALLQVKLEDFDAQVAPELRKTLELPIAAGLYEISKIIVHKHRENLWFLRVMLFAALESHHLGQLFFKQRLPLLEFLQEFFDQKISNREARNVDPAILARAFIAMIHHYILITLVFKAKDHFPLPEDAMLESFVDIFTKGVRP
ncbi:MAG: TetR/AcrR family transcriptional regulator [Deltaproteobacteria bacterium]|nr:TetR/AcrR family transcriptional regulator [Deltaproteobacteria bacterium]